MLKSVTIKDGADSFTVSIHQSIPGSPVVLFAVGAGGVPERHATLLNTCIDGGYTVIAPHFERLVSRFPEAGDLTVRARRLSLAIDSFSQPDSEIVGVGHSIGAATLVAMAGAQMWLRTRQCVSIEPDHRLHRLVLLAPPTGFFQAPGALNEVRIPIGLWVGTEDELVPVAHCEWLAGALPEPEKVDFRVIKGAGHFSFMDTMPPNTKEPLPDKKDFLRSHSMEIVQFIAR